MPIPSYVCGVTKIPLLGETIGAHFDRAAAQWASKEALVAQDKPLVIKSGSGTFVTDIRSSAGERALTSSRAR